MEKLVAAIDRGDWERALELARVAWAASPQLVLAELVVALGERVTRTRTSPIVGTRRLERKQSWLAAARRHDPRDLELLLATLEEANSVQEWVMRFRVVARARDPRIDRFVAAYEAARPHVNWQIRPELVRYRAGMRPPPPDEPAYAPLVATVRAPEASERATTLLAAIYAAPDSDLARMIYADELQSRGDPRGEFVALQLSNAPGTSERASELLGLYRERWLGVLAPYVEHVTFARGFPATCRMRSGAPPSPDDPAWSTMVEVHGVPPLASMRALRTLFVRLAPDVAQLGPASALPPIQTLVLEVGDLELRDGAWPPARAAAIPAFTALRLPALRELRIVGGYTWAWERRAPTPTDLAWALQDRTLDSLTSTSGPEYLGVWWEELHRTQAIREVKLVPFLDHGASVEITRDRVTVIAAQRLGGDAAREDVRRVARGLSALPGTALTSVVVSLPKQASLVATPHLAELEAACRAQVRATIDISYRK